MRQSKTVTACLVLTAAVSLAAQQSSTSQPQQRPTFRSGTNLVLVDVYPMKDGRILQNLEQTDFEVFEDGKPQKVENFQFIKVEGRAPEAEKRDPNTQEEGNELAADPKNRVFVVYLDTKGVSIEGAYRSRRPLVEMLNRIMAPNDLFGVVTTEMAPAQLVLGRKLLTTEDMLARYWPWGQRGSIMRTQEEQNLNQCTISPTTNKEMYVDDRGIQRRMIDVMIDRLREDKALEHLESTITYMSGLRQTRTALIVFTEGWLLFQTDLGLLTPLQVFKSYDNTPAIGTANGRPIISTSAQAGSGAACLREMTRLAMLDNRTRYNDLLRRAARANVVFYPVNPIGLTMFDYPIWQDATPTMPTDPNQEPKMLLVEQLNRIKDRADGLLQAADTTGGIAVVNTNKIEAGLDRIAAQLEAYYVLGYYSTNQAFDGRYRQISVKMKVPGVQISARKGYTAPTKAEMAAMDAPKAVVAPEIAAAETAKADALGMLSRIRGSAELYGAGVQTKAGEVTLVVEVASQLAEAGKWLAGADVQAVVTTGAGDMAGSGRAKLEPGVRGVAIRVPVTGDGPWHAQLRLRNGADAIETTAEVKPLARGGASALVSDPIVFRGDPGGVQPARPVADFLFRRTERVHIEWTTKGQIDTRQARLLDRAGNVLPVGVTLAEKPGAILAADLVLGPLGPGDYLIELEASGPAGSTRQLVAIRVQNN